MKVEVQIGSIEVKNTIEIPERISLSGLAVNMRHKNEGVERVDNAIKSRHKITANFLRNNNKIGEMECNLIVVISDLPNIGDTYNTWKEGYEKLDIRFRRAIENAISFTVMPAISVLLDKMRLPPVIPPIAFSVR